MTAAGSVASVLSHSPFVSGISVRHPNFSSCTIAIDSACEAKERTLRREAEEAIKYTRIYHQSTDTGKSTMKTAINIIVTMYLCSSCDKTNGVHWDRQVLLKTVQSCI